jgi:hypothetical protein
VCPAGRGTFAQPSVGAMLHHTWELLVYGPRINDDGRLTMVAVTRLPWSAVPRRRNSATHSVQGPLRGPPRTAQRVWHDAPRGVSRTWHAVACSVTGPHLLGPPIVHAATGCGIRRTALYRTVQALHGACVRGEARIKTAFRTVTGRAASDGGG